MPASNRTTRPAARAPRGAAASTWAIVREVLLVVAFVSALRLSLVTAADAAVPSDGSCPASTDGGSGSCASEPSFARIVAIPDIHGDLHHYRQSLRLAGVVDGEDAPIEWTAGDSTHLVQTGDVVDRGQHSLLIMDMLANLTVRAKRVGGKVTALMGNHELMSGLMDDTRYVHKDEILLLGTKELDALRELGGEGMGASYGISAKWQTGTMVWHRSFDPDAKQGRRLRRRRPLATVAGSGFCKSLFSHAGVRSRHLDAFNGGVDAMNEAAAAAIQGKPDIGWLHHHPLYDNESPVWNRFYSREDDDGDGEVCDEVNRVLTATGANRMVIGHTVQSGGMRTKCGGKLHLIDVGMSSAYVGRGAAWICEGGEVRARYADGTELLEKEADGENQSGGATAVEAGEEKEKKKKKGWW